MRCYRREEGGRGLGGAAVKKVGRGFGAAAREEGGAGFGYLSMR